MILGNRSGSFCYDNNSTAQDAYWSSTPATISTDGRTVSAPEKVSGVWKIKTVDNPKNGSPTTTYFTSPTLTFPICDAAASVTDGLVLGWLVVMVWAAAWSISYLRRVING